MHSDERYHTFAGSCRRRRPPDARGEGRFVTSFSLSPKLLAFSLGSWKSANDQRLESPNSTVFSTHSHWKIHKSTSENHL
jgi:hypothetical protein